jgi:hypothetical protein
MTAIAGAGYLVMRRVKGRRAAVAYGVYLLAGAIITVAARYDIVPALAVLGALLAAQRRRFGLAYVLLAVGFLLKVFPIALAPLVILEQRRVGLLTGRAWVGATVRDLAPALALTALVLGAAGATGWWHVDSAFRYQSHRPIQVESAPGSVLWLLSFAGFPALSAQGYSSANLVGPLAPYVNSAFWDAGLIAMAALYWLCLRGRLDLGRAFIVATAVVLLASKVLSPQFLIWILPLVAAVEGLDAGWLLVAVLTTAIYPVMYYEFGLLGRLTPPPYPGAFLAVILVRNVLLGALTVRLLHPRLALAWPPRPAGSAAVVPARRITLE